LHALRGAHGDRARVRNIVEGEPALADRVHHRVGPAASGQVAPPVRWGRERVRAS
jgi:hypothetical protein